MLVTDHDLNVATRHALFQERDLQIAVLHTHTNRNTTRANDGPNDFSTHPGDADLGHFQAKTGYVPRTLEQRTELVDYLAAVYPPAADQHWSEQEEMTDPDMRKKGLQEASDLEFRNSLKQITHDELDGFFKRPISTFNDLDVAHRTLADALQDD